MRRAALMLAALAVIGLAAGTALAGQGYRGYGGGRYGGYGSYGGYGYSYSYGSRGYGYGGGYRSSSFSDAARRVQGKYSTYRYSTHPRSHDKSVPYRYQYWGW